MSNETMTSVAAPEASAAPSVPQNIDQLAAAVDQRLNPKTETSVAPTTPAEVKQEIKRIKQLQLKVNGKEYTEDLPFEIDDNPEVIKYMTKELQMSRAAQIAMQEKGSFEKQVESFFQNLKGNTAQVLSQMGIDPVKFAAEQLEAEIKKQQLSPEERKNQELEEKLRRLEEDNKRKEQEFNRQKYESEREKIHDRIEAQMIQALDKSDVPYTPEVADRIAKYMMLGLQDPDGPVELTPEDVIPLVREDLMNGFQHILKGMNTDQIQKFIGREHFDNVRKTNIQKIKTSNTTPATAKAAIREVTSQQKPSLQSKDVPKINMREFFKI